MQKNQIIMIAIIAFAVVAICAIGAFVILRVTSTPEATATVPVPIEPTFTSTAEAVGGGVWERIQASGTIIVGTSADYPPFEYYADETHLDGFDIALMDAIAQRLGLQVQYKDFAFEGLTGALQLGQIDIAIAAISVTPEREAIVDFSDVYFVGSGSALADAGSAIADITSPDQLAAYTVGVQRGTVYQDWVQTNLVDTGQMPAQNLLAYEKASDAVRDLTQQRVQLVLMDTQPAEVAAKDAGVKLVGEGINQQRFSIAIPKGETELKTQLDESLTDLNNSGLIAQLAKQYLDLDPHELQPTPTPTPVPAASSTPVPPPVGCIDGLALVKHLSFDDQNMSAPPTLNPGTPFVKGWRVQNTGTCTWDTSYQLVYVQGNKPAARMGGKPTKIQAQVPPGQTYDVSVDLVAPLHSGTYQGLWQMENGSGQGFGERLQVGIRVEAQATVTPVPTQTPVPGITFTVGRDHIKSGECVVFHWNVAGVQAVYFYADGERWQDHGVAGQGSQQECPPVTTTYNLRVVYNDGSVDTRQITVYVEASPDAPYIQRFTADPQQITLGQCVDIRWDVEGNVTQVRITANGADLWPGGAPTSGKLQDCPTQAGNVGYAIDASGPGGTSQGQENVKVHGEAPPTPLPTQQPPDQPVIYSFSVTPEEIPAGACVTISWSTGGGVSWVTVLRDEYTVLDNAPFTSQAQDCPPTAGDVLYRLLAYNPEDVKAKAKQTVTVR